MLGIIMGPTDNKYGRKVIKFRLQIVLSTIYMKIKPDSFRVW